MNALRLRACSLARVVFVVHGVLEPYMAHTLPCVQVWRSVVDGAFASSSGGFCQNPQIVAEDRAADRRGEIPKTAKTASYQPEGSF